MKEYSSISSGNEFSEPTSDSDDPVVEKSSIIEATNNYIKGLIGVGFITIPYYASQVGYLTSSLIIIACAYASIQGVRMLVRVVDDMDHHHALYGHVVKRIFGPKIAICFDVYAFIAIVSNCITCIIFFEILLSRSFGGYIEELPQVELFVLSLLITIPLSLVTNINDMKLMSWLGILSCVLTVFLVLSFEIYAVFVDHERVYHYKQAAHGNHPFRLIATVIFTFQNIFLALPIRRQMENPKDFKYVILYSYSSFGTLLIIFVVGTIVAFGKETEFLAIYNVSNMTVQNTAVLLFAFSILIAYSVNIYPAHQIVDFYLHEITYLVDHQDHVEETNLTCQSAALRIALTLFVYLCAYVLYDLSTIICIFGVILGIYLQFILPTLLFLLWFHRRVHWYDFIQGIVIVALAMIAILVGISDLLYLTQNLK